MSALDKVLTAHATRELALAAGDGELDEHAPDDYSLGELVEATDAALDEACRIFAGCDFSACPPEVRQGINLVMAASVTVDGLVDHLGLPDPDSDTRLSWVERTAFDPLSVRLADGDGSKPYGDVPYADPGYQSDGKKRYPIDTEKHIRAAWSYINQGDNASAYSSKQLAAIKAAIKSAAGKQGIEISDDSDSKKVAATAVGGGEGYVMLAMTPSEMASAHHEPFHGTHVHAHTHLGDASHGPEQGSPFDHGMMPAHAG